MDGYFLLAVLNEAQHSLSHHSVTTVNLEMTLDNYELLKNESFNGN